MFVARSAKIAAILGLINVTLGAPLALAQASNSSGVSTVEIITDAKSAEKKVEQALAPIQDSFSISDEKGATIPLGNLWGADPQGKPLIFHMEKQDLHLLVDAKPISDSKFTVFLQIVDKDNQPTNHFTQTTIDARQDISVTQAVLGDAAKILISDAKSARVNLFSPHAKVAKDFSKTSRSPAAIDVRTFALLVSGITLLAAGISLMALTLKAGGNATVSAFILVVEVTVIAMGGGMLKEALSN